MVGFAVFKLKRIMINFDGVGHIDFGHGLVEEHLAVSEVPISECHHHDWGQLHGVNGHLVQFSVESWRLLIIASQKNPFEAVLVEHAEETYGK